MSDRGSSLVSVNVLGEPDTEFFVIDHALQLVARGPLPWSGALGPGVYKFKFRRGTAIQEQSVFLDPETPVVTMSAPALRSVSPVPLEASSRTHEYHVQAAVAHSRHPQRMVGAGGELFVLVRDWTRYEDPARTERPAAGLKICDAFGTVVADVDAEAAKGGQGTDDRWAALNLGLTPGDYLLRLETLNSGILEQAMVVSPGWQTQVFLLLDNYGDASTTDWRADVTRAAVLMARLGRGFDPNDEEFRLTDTARAWLCTRQRSTAGEAIKRALTLKFESPMLGIYAAHALIGGQSRLAMTSAQGFEEGLFRTLLTNLERLAPGHPDLLALQLWLDGEHALPPPLSTPPMLASSWSIVVAASASHPALIARQSLAARIGGSLWGGGPFLIWMRDQLGVDEAADEVDVSAMLEKMRRALTKVLQPDRLALSDLNDVQRALLQHAAPVRVPRDNPGPALAVPKSAAMPTLSQARSAEQLVTSLGVPLETLQHAAVGLMKKMSNQFQDDDGDLETFM